MRAVIPHRWQTNSVYRRLQAITGRFTSPLPYPLFLPLGRLKRYMLWTLQEWTRALLLYALLRARCVHLPWNPCILGGTVPLQLAEDDMYYLLSLPFMD